MTAAEEAKPDVVPQIDRDAERTAHSAATVINSALQHMGLGPDPWKGIIAGVGRLKPFVQAGSRSRYARGEHIHPLRWRDQSSLLVSHDAARTLCNICLVVGLRLMRVWPSSLWNSADVRPASSALLRLGHENTCLPC